MNKAELGKYLDMSLNEFKHLLDFGPIAVRRKKRARYQIEQTGILKHLRDGKSYLDIGCGKGYIGGEIKSRMNSVKIFGIDLNDRPTKRMRKAGSHEFSTANARNLPFPNDCFDGVMIFFVMHHMETDSQIDLLKEAVRITRSGGLIFIAEDTVAQGDIDQQKVTTKADKRFNPDFKQDKPHSYRSREDWARVFGELHLNSIDSVDYHTGKVPHAFFVLSKEQVLTSSRRYGHGF